MTTETIERDELGEQLIEAGLAPNGFILDLNHSLTVPHTMELPAPWNLPSRLFRFPIEVSEARVGSPRRIGLMHPELGDHPFVRQIEALGFELDPNGAPNAYGVSKTSTALWWHAVDLMTSGHWRDLIETRRFTTDRLIGQAVAHGLRYSDHREEGGRSGHISTSEAREIMRLIGWDEPQSRSEALFSFDRPSPCKQDSGKVHWAINTGRIAPLTEAWGMIHGIEDGWFAHDRAGFLHWTEKGRERHAAGDAPTFVESTGQAAFAF